MLDMNDNYTRNQITNILNDEQSRAEIQSRISVILKPELTIDGDKWCALYGENLQGGVAGFGDSPEEAYRDFDLNWYKKLKPLSLNEDKTKGVKNMKLVWLTLLIILIPLWAVLYLMGVIGYVGHFLWNNLYHSIYRLSGSPLDSK